MEYPNTPCSPVARFWRQLDLLLHIHLHMTHICTVQDNCQYNWQLSILHDAFIAFGGHTIISRILARRKWQREWEIQLWFPRTGRAKRWELWIVREAGCEKKSTAYVLWEDELYASDPTVLSPEAETIVELFPTHDWIRYLECLGHGSTMMRDCFWNCISGVNSAQALSF